MTPADTMRAAVEALEETRRVDEFGRQPEAHWESLRDMRRSVIEKQDAALSLLRSALEGGEPELTEAQIEGWRSAYQVGTIGSFHALCHLIWNTASIPPITPVEAGKVGVAAGVTAVQAPSELWKATDALLNALTAYEIAQQGQSDQLQRFAAGLVAAKRRAGEALNAHGAAVGAKPCPYCDAPPGHAHSSSCPDGVLDRVGAVIAKATAGVAACGSSLSDAQCNQFRALPVSFNEMVRAIYAAGYAAGSIDEKERTAGVMASDGGQR